MKNRHYLFIILLVLPLLILGQTEDLDKSINKESKKLQDIRAEISRLNSKINKTRKDEKATLKQIQALDKQISLISQLKKDLKKERKIKEEQINVLSETIQTSDEKIRIMKARLAQRAVHAYKMGQNRDVDLILTSGDINQVLRRSTYLSAINRAERKTLEELRTMIAANKRSQDDLAQRLGRVKRNIQEKERTSKQISSQQKQKEAQLRNIKRDTKSLQERQKTLKKAEKAVEQNIADLDKEKQAREEWARSQGLAGYGEFAKYKGKLNWPVQGTLVSRFGPHKHEKLGTVTNNPGIDIAAPKGRTVRVVQNGIVVAITWIPGYGNTIIVDHGDSYYTVYAHVDNIKVNMNTAIFRGDIVALVSDTGSLDGPRLHFEVWKGKNKEDPLKWLKR